MEKYRLPRLETRQYRIATSPTQGRYRSFDEQQGLKHDRHFRHCWKHPRGPFLGKAREVDLATPEEARGCRRAATRSARLSDAVLRSGSNAGHAGSPAL